ncbi:MAG: CoA transferase [Deltaproteobacteria bacterium]|nr:CoA transferase [Deltaproteobacteria bacterium]MBW2084972.1 CoA transferase [Deltaproteobacteria bacterium]
MNKEGALSDLKVIDLGHYIAGPYCTSLLAGLGAEVIKVERPQAGDPARQMGPFPKDEPHLEKSGLFHYLNLGKKSITLNLKSRAGAEAFKKLVAEADVLIENFAPRVMPSLGLKYDALKEINPALIMTSISNYGQTGPYRDYKGLEITLSALGGVQAEIGEQGREPIKLGGQHLQFQAGLTGALATMGAVCYRDLRGSGQHIDLAIVEIAATLKGCPTMNFQFNGHNRIRNGARPMSDMPQSDPRIPGLYPIAILPCKDGYVCVDTEMEEQYRMLVEMMGRPELLDDPRFSDVEQRSLHADELDAVLKDYLKTKTQKEVFEEATEWRVPIGILNDMDRLFHDPQHRDRGFFTKIDHPLLGKMEFPGHIFLMSETPWQVSRAPMLGEHNSEILIERLGYSEDDLKAMTFVTEA